MISACCMIFTQFLFKRFSYKIIQTALHCVIKKILKKWFEQPYLASISCFYFFQNKDGLLYVEVQFDTKTEERNPVIHGDDEKTDYATVEFPVPSSSHDREQKQKDKQWPKTITLKLLSRFLNSSSCLNVRIFTAL